MTAKRYIVFAPHRDDAAAINAAKRRLFEAGAPGAYSFPAVCLLARTGTPLPYEALKEAARLLREDAGGGLLFDAPSFLDTGGLRLWGLRPSVQGGAIFERAARFLRDSASASASGAAERQPAPLFVLCVLPPCAPAPEAAATEAAPGTAAPEVALEALAAESAAAESGGASADGLPRLPPFCFRSGFLANMVIDSLPAGERAYSFQWKLGKAAWLPRRRP